MESPREIWRRLTSIARRGEMESAMSEEIAFHIDRQTDKNIKSGMSPEDARRAAVLRFGGVDRMKERAREEFRPVLMEDLSRDVRFAGRTLMRSPAFALASVLTLGLGIGAATAVFSVVYGVLLRPLPYPEAERIVRLNQVNKDGNPMSVSEPNYEDWKAQSRSYSELAEFAPRGEVSVLSPVGPSRARVAVVSKDFFTVLRAQPRIGRAFLPEEQQQGGTRAAIVSDDYWRVSLDATPDLSAQTLTFDQRVYQVIGVMPPGLDFPSTNIWIPRELEPPQTSRTAHNFQVIARLRDDVTVEQAQQELSAISRALKVQHGDETWMSDALVMRVQEQMTAPVKPALIILLGAAGVLLLIACANVSNLMLARLASRKREIAVRLALGAGRWRVARQLVAEALVLCIVGGALGVALAFAGTRALLAFEPGNLPRVSEVRVSGGALAFALGVSLLTALLLGLATTLRAGTRDLRGALAAGQRTLAGGQNSQRVRDGLVVAQVALTLVLLSGGGLLGRSFLRLLNVDLGYRTGNAVVLDIALPYPESSDEGRRQALFQDALMTRFRALPGVTDVGGISDFPLGGGNYGNGQFIEMTRPDEIQTFEDYKRLPDAKERAGYAGYRVASEGYFRTMGIPLVRGRVFDAGDGFDAAHVAVISESLAKTKWPNQDPLGRFIQFGNMDGDLRGLRIIGVVGDVREQSPEALPGPLLYSYYRQRPSSAARFSIVLRGGDPAATSSAAQRVVREMNPQLPLRVRTMQEAFDRSVADRRFSLILLGVFGAAALILATMGIYAVISYLVAQRTREIGIRLALGARAGDVVGMIVGKGARLALFGTIVGLAVSLALGRVLTGFLYGITATDPVAFAAVLLFITAAVIVATYVPARRATGVAPAVTLRE